MGGMIAVVDSALVMVLVFFVTALSAAEWLRTGKLRRAEPEAEPDVRG